MTESRWRRRASSPGVVLALLIFWSTLDRSVILPLVPIVADDFGSSVATTATAVSGHALAFALFQLIWGPLSARWGRIRILVASTALAGIANIVSALAPDLSWFIASRVASGAAFAATFAAVLTYIGDTLPFDKRPAAMSNMATAVALALGAGTLAAGGLAEWISWRWMFGVYALITILLVPFIARLVDPPAGSPERIVAQVVVLVRNRWVIALVAITALEGFLLIGVFNILPSALQAEGASAVMSGAVTAGFGIAVIVVSQLTKLIVTRIPSWTLLVGGGASAALAFALLVVSFRPATVLLAATLMGVAWALAHPLLQTWMTDVAFRARALGMTSFSMSLMLGAALGTAVSSSALEGGMFGVALFGSLLGSIVFAVAAGASRARYRLSGAAE